MKIIQYANVLTDFLFSNKFERNSSISVEIVLFCDKNYSRTLPISRGIPAERLIRAAVVRRPLLVYTAQRTPQCQGEQESSQGPPAAPHPFRGCPSSSSRGQKGLKLGRLVYS